MLKYFTWKIYFEIFYLKYLLEIFYFKNGFLQLLYPLQFATLKVTSLKCKVVTQFGTCSSRLTHNNATGGYECLDISCYWDLTKNDDEWGYYSKTIGDCKWCTEQCTADPNCDAVECGSGYCSWWKTGTCPLSNANASSDTHTCRAPGDLVSHGQYIY